MIQKLPAKITANGVVGLVTLGLVGVVVGLWLTTSDLQKAIANLQTQVNTPTVSRAIPSTSPIAPTASASAIITQPELVQLVASVAALSQSVTDLETRVTALQSATPAPAATAQSSFTKETLYLGSTSTTSRSWVETPLEVGINSAAYPAGVSAKLEAGTSIIGGEVWVRLKNKSTGAVITASELSNNSSAVTWKTSPGFSLHSGGYTYVLEARSSSGETANVAGARIIIENNQ